MIGDAAGLGIIKPIGPFTLNLPDIEGVPEEDIDVNRVMQVGVFNQYMRTQFKGQMEKYRTEVLEAKRDQSRSESRGKKLKSEKKKSLLEIRKNTNEHKKYIQELAAKALQQRNAQQAAAERSAAQRRASQAAASKKSAQKRKQG